MGGGELVEDGVVRSDLVCYQGGWNWPSEPKSPARRLLSGVAFPTSPLVFRALMSPSPNYRLMDMPMRIRTALEQMGRVIRPVILGWADTAGALPRSFRIGGYVIGSVLLVAAAFWGFGGQSFLAAAVFAVLGVLILIASSEKLTLPEEVFTADPIQGWRQWRVLRTGDPTCGARASHPILLAGLTNGQTWDERRLEASCAQGLREWDSSPGMHSAPDPLCSCGVYAWKDRSQALSYNPVATAVGEVRLWGRVFEAERGYRAQFAELAGDLGLVVACHAQSERCGEVVGVLEEQDGFKSYCALHTPDSVHLGSVISLDSFLDQLESDFRRRYRVDVSPVR